MRRRIRSAFRAWTRWLHTGRAVAILGGLLFVDFVTLPMGSGAKQLLPERMGATHCYFGPRGEVVRDPSGVHVVEAGTSSLPTIMFLAFPTWGVHTGGEGFWAATRYVDRHQLRIDRSVITAAEEATVRREYADMMISHGGWYAEQAPLIRNGDTITTRALPWGYVHNAASLLVGATFVWSALVVVPGALVRSWKQGRAQREQWTLAQGICPKCRYDLTGHPDYHHPRKPPIVCPECGTNHWQP